MSANLAKRMDNVQEHLINVNACLRNMEQGGSKEDADTVPEAKAKLERDTTTKKLKETNRTMEMAGHLLTQ